MLGLLVHDCDHSSQKAEAGGATPGHRQLHKELMGHLSCISS